MLKEIESKKYDLLSFTPFVDYLRQLEQLDLVLVSQEDKYGFNELIFYTGQEYIKLLIFKDDEKEWGTIYKYKEEHCNYEQIEFMVFNEKYSSSTKNYNRLIKYSAHLDDETTSKLVTSAFTYLNNTYISGWIEKRKIDIEDLDKIYSLGMNLTELVLRAERKQLEFHETISLKKGEVKELKLTY